MEHIVCYRTLNEVTLFQFHICSSNKMCMLRRVAVRWGFRMTVSVTWMCYFITHESYLIVWVSRNVQNVDQTQRRRLRWYRYGSQREIRANAETAACVCVWVRVCGTSDNHFECFAPTMLFHIRCDPIIKDKCVCERVPVRKSNKTIAEYILHQYYYYYILIVWHMNSILFSNRCISVPNHVYINIIIILSLCVVYI